MLLKEIKCVKREKGCVVAISGVKAPDSSNGVPEDIGIRAVDGIKGPISYLDPTHGKLFIQFITVGVEETKCFFIEDPNNPSHNLLDNFDEC